MSTDSQLETQRDIGRLEGSVAAIETRLESIDAKLDHALAHINAEKGGKRSWLFVTGVLGGLAGLGSAAAQWLGK